MNELVMITGLSGAGRSSVGNNLEDLGFFVIDNLPPEMIPKVLELAFSSTAGEARVALAVGAGTSYDEMQAAVDEAKKSDTLVRSVFLDSSNEVLVRRYESSKRRHPMSDGSGLEDAIVRERELLQPVKANADLVIDTSHLNVHQLKARIVELFGESIQDSMSTKFMSFGYKHGMPNDVDLVLDCRFLTNPYWNEELRDYTGLDDPVKDFVLGLPQAQEFLSRLTHLLELLLPAYRDEGKAYLTIALGCTGGHHRSVAMAEELSKRLSSPGSKIAVQHRDIAK